VSKIEGDGTQKKTKNLAWDANLRFEDHALKLVKSGEISEWDSSIMTSLLIYSKLVKGNTKRKERKAATNIKNIRNLLSHGASAKIKRDKYKKYYNDLLDALGFLGGTQVELDYIANIKTNKIEDQVFNERLQRVWEIEEKDNPGLALQRFIDEHSPGKDENRKRGLQLQVSRKQDDGTYEQLLQIGTYVMSWETKLTIGYSIKLKEKLGKKEIENNEKSWLLGLGRHHAESLESDDKTITYKSDDCDGRKHGWFLGDKMLVQGESIKIYDESYQIKVLRCDADAREYPFDLPLDFKLPNGQYEFVNSGPSFLEGGAVGEDYGRIFKVRCIQEGLSGHKGKVYVMKTPKTNPGTRENKIKFVEECNKMNVEMDILTSLPGCPEIVRITDVFEIEGKKDCDGISVKVPCILLHFSEHGTLKDCLVKVGGKSKIELPWLEEDESPALMTFFVNIISRNLGVVRGFM